MSSRLLAIPAFRPGRSRAGERPLLLATFVDGAGTGVFASVSAVLVARRFGAAAAGLVVAVGVIGRVSAVWGAALIERRLAARAVTAPSSAGADVAGAHPSVSAAAAVYRGLVWAMTLSSMAAVAAAAWAPLWAAAACTAVFVAANNLTTGFVNRRGVAHIVRLGPVGMVGQAAGAAYVSLVLLAADALPGWVTCVLIAAGLGCQQLQVWAMSLVGHAPAGSAPAPWRSLTGPLRHGFALAFCSYGPLAIYAVLVVDVTSLVWVGPAMVAYAAGSMAAPWLDRTLRFGHSPSGLLLVAAVGVGSWSLAWSGPLVVVARVVAGMTMFAVQGRFLRQAAGSAAGPSSLVAAGTGLGLGTSAGAWVAGMVVERSSVPLMGALFASVCVAAAAAVALMRRRRAGDSAAVG